MPVLPKEEKLISGIDAVLFWLSKQDKLLPRLDFFIFREAPIKSILIFNFFNFSVDSSNKNSFVFDIKMLKIKKIILLYIFI